MLSHLIVEIRDGIDCGASIDQVWALFENTSTKAISLHVLVRQKRVTKNYAPA
jgi:hypothetical protein